MVKFYKTYGFVPSEEFVQPLEVVFSTISDFPIFATMMEARQASNKIDTVLQQGFTGIPDYIV